MKAHTASLLNAIVLIACSVWAFAAIGGSSWTALIPAVFGVALLLCYRGVRDENKVIAHVAVLLTLLIIFALYMPLSSALQSGAVGALVRSVAMLATSILALVYFIKSFRDARRARSA
ncbi:MAG: hypothetical protein AAF667_01600 [Pseudomonadota bacterium]